jgi:hypothetical protein
VRCKHLAIAKCAAHVVPSTALINWSLFDILDEVHVGCGQMLFSWDKYLRHDLNLCIELHNPDKRKGKEYSDQMCCGEQLDEYKVAQPCT